MTTANTRINMMETTMKTTKFEGMEVRETEDGFAWQEGGYFDTIEECHTDIAQWNRSLVSDENIYGDPAIEQSIAEDRGCASF